MSLRRLHDGKPRFGGECFALSPTAIALLPPPPPDGGYPGQNIAEGDHALYSLETGSDNTAVGAGVLGMDTLYIWHAIIDLDGMNLFLK